MCGRIAQFGTFREIVELINIWNAPVQAEASPPRYNVAPATRVQVLNIARGTLLARQIRWGWRPHWAIDKPAPINARSEKVAHGPFFRAIWPHRALCPIDGWYEWVDEGGPKKQPYFIRRRDGKPTLCASIGQFPHEEPQNSDGFVIITADSQGGMIDIHDRRPIVFAPALATEWLDPATPKARAEEMLAECEPANVFEWYRVDKAVGNVRNDYPGLVEPTSAPL